MREFRCELCKLAEGRAWADEKDDNKALVVVKGYLTQNDTDDDPPEEDP